MTTAILKNFNKPFSTKWQDYPYCCWLKYVFLLQVTKPHFILVF